MLKVKLFTKVKPEGMMTVFPLCVISPHYSQWGAKCNNNLINLEWSKDFLTAS